MLKFHIDQPDFSAAWTRDFIIRGWCFDPAGRPVDSVRLVAGTLVFTGVAGLPRPDVKTALPDAPDDFTGFEIRGALPAGSNAIVIAARTTDGQWTDLMRVQVRVRRRLIPLWAGGGDWYELLSAQTPVHMIHPPRPIGCESFPRTPGSGAPKLSIVTPSFNQSRFLGETMRGVLDQDVPVKYVVMDGGSTDGSADLIRGEAGRLHAWSSKRDTGQADAIAKGFAQTSGRPEDLMAWINSDDFYLPGALAFVADYFARHPDVDVIYGHRIVVNEESCEIARWFLPPHNDDVLRLNDFVPQETLFWRRRIWEKVEGLNTSFKFAMDWDLLLRFQAAGARIVRVPYFLACFRVHPAQKTSAQMHSLGQHEIDQLRERANGRAFTPRDLEGHPALLRYLRQSAGIEFLWKLGLRAP